MTLFDQFPHKCTIRQRTRSSNDDLMGSYDSHPDVQTDVVCWEQQASASEVQSFQKRGMSVSRKIFFLTDPGVDETNQIVITERMRVAVSADDQIPLDVMSETLPDASAGLGVLYKVMVNDQPSERQ